jgi:hypothetical protein
MSLLSHQEGGKEKVSCNTSTLDPTLTDSLPGAFITEMDPTDPGPSQGCYTDDSLDPLHTRTLETVTQVRVPLGLTHKSECPRWAWPHLGDIPIDTLDRHDSTRNHR